LKSFVHETIRKGKFGSHTIGYKLFSRLTIIRNYMIRCSNYEVKKWCVVASA